MDVFNLYLATFRYIMNANPEDKTTWCDIFKYIPCLRHNLSCCVCGQILLVPHGVPARPGLCLYNDGIISPGFCLHNVCRGCLGGRMRVRPACNWCRDQSSFQENKKLRVLIMCFKRLCAYVSCSSLGAEIAKASINGYGSEAERTIKVFEEAEQFQDDYIFTPPPTEFPHIAKSASRGLQSHYASSGAGLHHFTQPCKRKRGRPKSVPKLSMRPANLNISNRVRKLKKMALSSVSKRSFVKTLLPQKRLERKQRPLPDTSGLLISQRPHRDKSGKSSIGQLWRETFLEEVQLESYPDSGIEVGNSPDHDQYTHSSSQSTKLVSGKADSVGNKPESFRKETRHHKYSEVESKDTSVNDVSSTTDDIQKPRLTLTISKKRFQTFSRKGRSLTSTTSSRFNDTSLPLGKKPAFSLAHANLSSRLKKASLASNSTGSAKHLRNVCKCTRFLQPNQLTCFGQKCPCYSGRRPCVDCLCNGCKNPMKSSDFAPPLTHMKEADGLDHSLDRSMPRLSPIPRI